MIIVESRYSNKSRTIAILILVVATILAILLPFLVWARAQGPQPKEPHPSEEPAVAHTAELANSAARNANAPGETGLASPATPTEMVDVTDYDYDVILRGGALVGESRLFGAGADVGLRDGYIYAVGDLAGATAAKEIDATGIKYAIIDGRLAFAATQWADQPPHEEEGKPGIGKREDSDRLTTEERSRTR